jgi:hypothetical protein
MEEPRAGVIGEEANCDNIPSVTHTHNIPNNGVVEIVRRATSATDDVEVVPVQMNRMLLREVIAINSTMFVTAIRKRSQVHRWHPQERSTQHSC